MTPILITLLLFLVLLAVIRAEEPTPKEPWEIYKPVPATTVGLSKELMFKWYVNHINKFGVSNISLYSWEDKVEVINHYDLLPTVCIASSRNYLYINDATDETANYAIKHDRRDDGYNGQKCPGHGTIFYMSDFTCKQWHNTTNRFRLSYHVAYQLLNYINDPLGQYELVKRLKPTPETERIIERIRDQYPELFI